MIKGQVTGMQLTMKNLQMLEAQGVRTMASMMKQITKVYQ